ncbi:dead deah box rna [Cystoisospora suis]|uniref:Dead deah box rna n=1 Tax=Cystoisospora suis TaxID=483139 RepID=A0A2C6KSB6_9APIC|nr:dead deah box rna [Cystoisospora suis]
MAGVVGSGLLSQGGGNGSCSKRLREQQLDSSRKRKIKKRKADTNGSDAPATFRNHCPGSRRSRAERNVNLPWVRRTSPAEEDAEEGESEDDDEDDGEYGSEDTTKGEETGSEEDAECSDGDDDEDFDLSEGCLEDFSEGSFSDDEQSDSDEHGGETGASKGPSSERVPNRSKVEGDISSDKLEQHTGKQKRTKATEDLSAKEEVNDCRNSLLCTQMAWGDLPLSRPLLRAVEAMGYVHPTQIQAACLRPALEGRDLLANAQTGSGKTAAFLLPTLERLLHSPGVRARKMTANGPTGGLRGTKVLVLLPTRELAMQCVQMLQCLSKLTPITHALACGGMTLKAQEKALQQQPDIVVATPGRILDLLLNSPSVHLEVLEIIVLDEADRLLELGFREEILAVLRHCHRARQTLLFSATLTPSIASLAALALNAPLHISANATVNEATGCLSKSDPALSATPSLKTVSITLEQQFVMLQKEEHRVPALLHLCTTAYTKNVIVFFQTKQLAHRTSLLFKLLGLNCAELHGNLTQQMRVEALERFHAGEADFLLASELASRGLDIAGVEAVINFNVPQDIDRYIHSVGRTARMGKAGVSITLYSREGVEHLQVKRLLQALQGGQKGRGQGKQKGQDPERADATGKERRVLQRRIDTEKLTTLEQKEADRGANSCRSCLGSVLGLSRELKKEKLEREMRLAELHLKKAENLQAHADEIYSRPMRQWFMTAKEKQRLKESSKALVMCNNDSEGPAGKKCACAEKPDEEPEPFEASDQETEQESTADEEETELEGDQEGEDEDAQVSGDELPEWITAASSGDESASEGEEDGVVTVKEFKVAKKKQQQTANKEKASPHEHKKQAHLTAKQKERMKERQYMKAAARSVKRTQQPKRLRLTHDSPEDVTDDRRKRHKKQKQKRRWGINGSGSGEPGKPSDGAQHRKRGSRASGKGRFKSKGRYKRR